MPCLSVLVPVFNTARYLPGAIRSISQQSFIDFELIAVDDGSTDGSAELLKELASHEARMRLITRGNLGIVATRNELLREARGELVAWMDSDDISSSTRLARQYAEFQRSPSLVCLGTAAQRIDPDGEYLYIEQYPIAHEDIIEMQKLGGAMRFPTTMMRRGAALDVGGFREPFKIGEDFDLLLRLSESGTMGNLPDVLYFYRQHLTSTCTSLAPSWTIYRDHILELARQRLVHGSDSLQLGQELRIVVPPKSKPRRSEVDLYISWACCGLENGNRPLVRKYLVAALRSQPLSLRPWRLLFRVMLHACRTVLKSEVLKQRT